MRAGCDGHSESLLLLSYHPSVAKPNLQWTSDEDQDRLMTIPISELMGIKDDLSVQ